MEIYIVQKGDTINSIAEKFGVDVQRLIQDNGLENPYFVSPGQTIVITHPKVTHTVREGDTFQSIADLYQVTPMQILRNNPFLMDREYIYPGEIVVISYDTSRYLTTMGFTFPFINHTALKKSLLNLTYLSVYNYVVTEKGAINSYGDDTEIIQLSKAYGVIPLLTLTTSTFQGVPNIEVAYSVLMNDEYIDKMINDMIDIMKARNYYGVNIIFSHLNEINQSLHLHTVQKVFSRLQQSGYLFFLTFNYSEKKVDNVTTFEKINYSEFSPYVSSMTFLKFIWGTNYGPPAPVSNIINIKNIINYVLETGVPPDKVIIGQPLLGYDWELPYIPAQSCASALSITSTLDLAYALASIIEFDDDSQTPYFNYSVLNLNQSSEHVVWFIDARSVNALSNYIIEAGVNGFEIWNIMIYYPQVYTIIISQFDIVKLIKF